MEFLTWKYFWSLTVVFPKIYPTSQTDDNGIKPGSNLAVADKHVAEPYKAESLGIKQSNCDV